MVYCGLSVGFVESGHPFCLIFLIVICMYVCMYGLILYLRMRAGAVLIYDLVLMSILYI